MTATSASYASPAAPSSPPPPTTSRHAPAAARTTRRTCGQRARRATPAEASTGDHSAWSPLDPIDLDTLTSWRPDAFDAEWRTWQAPPDQAWAIVALDEFEAESDDRLYWSNTDGWVSSVEADRFTHADTARLRLPIGGAWVPMDWSPNHAG